ncbi:MAG TPA: hypothetical protein VG123_05090, partial [Streptosporangiaceae bacterium]|nr:hypothetical protein [Streptosporangiaceae bacterium]
ELRRVLEQPGPPPAPPGGRPPLAAAAQAANRFRAAAGALIAAGAIDQATATSVLAGLIEALTVRSKLPPAHPLRSLITPGFRPALPKAGLPGPERVLPVGKPVPFADGGAEHDLLHLLTLTLAPDLAVLTYAGHLPAPGHDPASGGLPAEPVGPYGPASVSGRLAFTDNHGTSYQASLSGGGTTDGTWWSGEFSLSPVPPGDARWIDIAPASGPGAVRAELTGPAAASRTPVRSRQPPAGALPAPATPAERLLDALAQDLLWSTLWTGTSGTARSELAGMIPALTAAGAIEPGSPALGRLAALAGRLGISPPAGLPAAPGASLPTAWDSALTGRGRHDGHHGLAPAAAVLPETDGARFAITGLYSTQHAVILRALAWGWHATRTPFPRTAGQYSWTALDDAGRWHVARQVNAPIGGISGHGYTDIALIPPLHPAATSLDVILTGPTTRASATLPLNWQPLG